MSDNVVDLFDKAALIEQRSTKQQQRVKEFATSIDCATRPLGFLFAGAIRYAFRSLPPLLLGGLNYGYQIRKAPDDSENAKIYFTGRSVLQRTLKGRQDRGWELFQLRFQPRLTNVTPRTPLPMIGFAEQYGTWLKRQDIQFLPSNCAAFWIMGALMSPEENYWIESIKCDGAIFEVQMASFNTLTRVRIYADALRSDETALIEAGILTSTENA